MDAWWRHVYKVYAAQPREGTETCLSAILSPSSMCWVYAAQPREGTETTPYNAPNSVAPKVYAAQPREGTETRAGRVRVLQGGRPWFMQLNPARGRKLESITVGVPPSKRFMQLNPARGRKQKLVLTCPRYHGIHGLCSSTPRGDGNCAVSDETIYIVSARFMQLNPARGRKR